MKQQKLKVYIIFSDEHIGNSRDSTFTDMVLSATNGKGCHIVITCLPANLKDVSEILSIKVVLNTYGDGPTALLVVNLATVLKVLGSNPGGGSNLGNELSKVLTSIRCYLYIHK